MPRRRHVRSTFTPREADEIRAALRRLRRANRLERAQITGRLRRVYGFWISDWRGALPWTVLAFTDADFDALVARGKITVRED